MTDELYHVRRLVPDDQGRAIPRGRRSLARLPLLFSAQAFYASLCERCRAGSRHRWLRDDS